MFLYGCCIDLDVQLAIGLERARQVYIVAELHCELLQSSRPKYRSNVRITAFSSSLVRSLRFGLMFYYRPISGLGALRRKRSTAIAVSVVINLCFSADSVMKSAMLAVHRAYTI